MRQIIGSLLVAASACCALACASGGCNVLGYAAQAVAGDEKVNAVYALPQRSTVVVAEKYSNPSVAAFDEEPLARFVTEELREHKAVTPLIESEQVYALRQKTPHDQWQSMTIDGVGRAVGAEQVLYVNIMTCQVQVAPGSEMLRGQAEVRVRLVDAGTGRTIWPEDAASGWPVSVQTPMARQGESATANEASVRMNVLRLAGERVGRLFYTYERP
jgi:hypothetical protein